jgi:hypothetical protein
MPSCWFDEDGYLLPEKERKLTDELVDAAIRNKKGMSTSLSIESLPEFRKPPKFGGTHVSIMPKATMLLEKYETALANTQSDWVLV